MLSLIETRLNLFGNRPQVAQQPAPLLKLHSDEIRHVASFLGDFNDVTNYSMVNKSTLVSLTRIGHFANAMHTTWVRTPHTARQVSIYEMQVCQLVQSIKLNRPTNAQLFKIQLLLKNCLYIEISNNPRLQYPHDEIGSLIRGMPNLKFINLPIQLIDSIMKKWYLSDNVKEKIHHFQALKKDNDDTTIALFTIPHSTRCLMTLSLRLQDHPLILKTIKAHKAIQL